MRVMHKALMERRRLVLCATQDNTNPLKEKLRVLRVRRGMLQRAPDNPRVPCALKDNTNPLKEKLRVLRVRRGISPTSHKRLVCLVL